MQELLNNVFEEHIKVTKLSRESLKEKIEAVAKDVVQSFQNGNKILLFGNGGSAGDAQHIAAEFTGRFVKERKGLPAIAITTDTSALTAIGNDYGYDEVFRRQIEALAKPGDILLGISTSGNSPNVLKALQYGKVIGCKTFGLSGRDGGKMNNVCDINIIIPSDVTARIQEMHILIGHMICEIADEYEYR
jgi:phosphoheptose isomerase